MSATAVPASTSYTPGQQSCKILLSQIRSFFSAVDDPDVNTVALAGLNSAIAMINSRTWKKLYGTTSITLVASTSTYGIPADFKESIWVLLLDGSSVRQGRLEFLTNSDFYETYSVANTGGSPQTYTYDYSTRKIELDVAPNSGYIAMYPTLSLRYHKRFAKLTCNGPTSLPPEFDEFLVARGASWLARSRDPDRAREFLGEAAERWRDLVRDDMENRTDYR